MNSRRSIAASTGSGRCFEPACAAGQAGFTLLEVLVAVAIFVIVGVLALTGYNELAKQSERVETGAARVRAVQSAIMHLNQDFASLEPRPVRQPIGDGLLPAVLADNRAEEVVELTRSGWSNPAGVPRPTLQRVAYRLQDNKLLRDYWVSLDHTSSVDPVSVVLLDRVKSVKLRFMPNNREWQDQWPPLGSNVPIDQRPLAVEVTLELEDWGKIVRLVEVPG
ncbi:MAG TPA: type II secretion system minor pseudopilin GspJ [Steroidobacteraceae bacterium]